MIWKRMVFLVVILCAFRVSAGLAQTSMSAKASREGGVTTFTATFSGPVRFMGPVVKGAPYSGEEVRERSQILGDGTHISQSRSARKIFRDSEGRTRTERPLMGRLDDGLDVKVIEIDDPVAGCRYILDAYNRVAHRLKMTVPSSSARAVPRGAASAMVSRSLPPPPAGTSSGPVAGSKPMRPEISSQPLGTQVMEGVLVEGTRRTTTYPVGMEGNDRPIVVTSENWFSRDLCVMVLSKTNDPRSGEMTMRLANLSTFEPDSGLFQVPPDYNVVDEEGEFTIQIKRP